MNIMNCILIMSIWLLSNKDRIYNNSDIEINGDKDLDSIDEIISHFEE